MCIEHAEAKKIFEVYGLVLLYDRKIATIFFICPDKKRNQQNKKVTNNRIDYRDEENQPRKLKDKKLVIIKSQKEKK